MIPCIHIYPCPSTILSRLKISQSPSSQPHNTHTQTLRHVSIKPTKSFFPQQKPYNLEAFPPSFPHSPPRVIWRTSYRKSRGGFHVTRGARESYHEQQQQPRGWKICSSKLSYTPAWLEGGAREREEEAAEPRYYDALCELPRVHGGLFRSHPAARSAHVQACMRHSTQVLAPITKRAYRACKGFC